MALSRAAVWRLGGFTTQALANTAWAFAKAGHVDEALFAMLAGAEQFIGEYNAQELANSAWAFATMDQPCGAQLDAISVLDALDA